MPQIIQRRVLLNFILLYRERGLLHDRLSLTQDRVPLRHEIPVRDALIRNDDQFLLRRNDFLVLLYVRRRHELNHRVLLRRWRLRSLIRRRRQRLLLLCDEHEFLIAGLLAHSGLAHHHSPVGLSLNQIYNQYNFLIWWPQNWLTCTIVFGVIALEIAAPTEAILLDDVETGGGWGWVRALTTALCNAGPKYP